MLKQILMTKLAEDVDPGALVMNVVGQTASRVMRNRKEVAAKETMDDIIKRRLKETGHSDIANNPSKLREFKILLRIPELKISREVGKIVGGGALGYMSQGVKEKLLDSLKNKLFNRFANYGGELVLGGLSEEALERGFKAASKGAISQRRIKRVAERYKKLKR